MSIRRREKINELERHMTQPPRLLVSVRDADEAQVALTCSVDIIDLKEPLRGSLGAVSPETAQEVANRVDGSCPLSLAMGELFDPPEFAYDHSLVTRFEFAKIGMAGCPMHADWQDAWLEWGRRLPPETHPVAVAYVDADAGSPTPEEVLLFAIKQGVRTVLLDTYVKKDGRNLFSWVSEDRLIRLIQQASKADISMAIAGSLSSETVELAMVMNPAIVAVRSAACSNGREGKLCANRISALKEIVLSSAAKNGAQ